MNPYAPKPARTSSAVIRAMFDIIDQSGMSYADVSAKTGIHAVTLSYWKHGKNAPRWVDFENLANALGYRIELVKND